MKKSLRLFSAILFSSVLMYGCSKTNDASGNKTNVSATPEFTLPSGQHYYGCLITPASVIAKLPHYQITDNNIEAKLPASITLAHPPVGDQGQQGSCTGWGAATTDAIYYWYKTGETSWDKSSTVFSPAYIYNACKIGSCNSGSYVSTVTAYLKSHGDCIWNDMPYTDASCSAAPSSAATADAGNHKISSYASINVSDLKSIKTALSNYQPVIIGIEVDNAFEALNSFNYTWKPNSSTILGGHCNTIIGYDNAKKAFLVQNQWGTSWGNAGIYYISYTMFTSSNSKIMEAYTVQ